MNKDNLNLTSTTETKHTKGLSLYDLRTEISSIQMKIKKSEQELKFEQIPQLQKELLRLKKIEEKRVLSKIEKTHQKEKSFFDKKYNTVYSTYSNKKDNETLRFKRKIKEMKTQFEQKQKIERDNFANNFNANYPKEDSLTKEIVKMKDRINFFAKRRDYANAQKLTNEMNQYIANKHEEYLYNKRREYTFALEKLLHHQKVQKEENERQIQNLIFEFNTRNNYEVNTLNRFKSSKMSTLNSIHNNELNTFKNYIYNDDKKNGLPISRTVNVIHA